MPAATAGSYNGLAFGPGTSYHVAAMEGFYELPEVRSNDLAKTTAAGYFVGTDRKGGRTVVLTLVLIADTPAGYDTLVDNLLAAMDVAGATERPLRFAGNTRYINCRPRKMAPEIDTERPQRAGRAVIEFFATDATVFTGAPPP